MAVQMFGPAKESPTHLLSAFQLIRTDIWVQIWLSHSQTLSIHRKKKNFSMWSFFKSLNPFGGEDDETAAESSSSSSVEAREILAEPPINGNNIILFCNLKRFGVFQFVSIRCLFYCPNEELLVIVWDLSMKGWYCWFDSIPYEMNSKFVPLFAGMLYLPRDLLKDIFLRVPMKSIARSRCVNKKLCMVLDDEFVKEKRKHDKKLNVDYKIMIHNENVIENGWLRDFKF